MKKLFACLLAAVFALSLASVSLAETADAFTSSSTNSYYGDYGLTGDELMEALNSFSGFYVITTVNPDGSPNAAYFVYACIKNEDKYYVQLSLAENQTRQNLLANGKAVGVYAVTPSGEEGSELYAVSGARMELTLVTDEDLLAVLDPSGAGTSLYCEITSCRSLG